MNVPLSIFLKIAFRTPDIFRATAAETLRARYLINLDYYLGKGYAFKPRYLDIKLTNKCNLRCKMCGQWGEKGNYLNAPKDVLTEELSLETLRRLVDEVSFFKPIIYLWGGEPFLYPHIKELIAYIKSKRMILAVNTNGTFVERDAEFLVHQGPDNLLISLDGPQEINDKIRGEGVFQRVLSGVKKIQEIKKEGRRVKPYLTMVSTISENNYLALEETLEMAGGQGFDFVGIQFSTFTTEALGKEYQRTFASLFNLPAESWKGFVADKSKISVDRLSEIIKKIRKRRYPFGIYFVPDLRPEEVRTYYQRPAELLRWKRCIIPWFRADILPNGDIYTCLDFPDYVVGNINKDSFLTIWNNRKYQTFRKCLKKQLFPICSRCCGLYQF